MTDFVLDNSVTMRWYFDKGSHPYADKVLHRLGASPDRALVPVLWRYEVSAVLARALKTKVIAAQTVRAFLQTLGALPISIDADSADYVLTDVHRLAVTYGLTSYDAAYLELAMRANLPLATLDAELITVCKSARVTLL